MIATERSGRAVFEECLARLASSPADDPARELQYLWRALVGELPVGAGGQKPVPDDRITDAVYRRVEGEPLAYIIGSVPFRHIDLFVDQRVLIPRPETEGLVALTLELAQPDDRLLEIGVGSGCVCLSLAHEGNFQSVTGVEQSREALQVARMNQQMLRLPVRLCGGNGVRPFGADSFDLVVSNPPYLTTVEVATLDESVRAWEPHSALEAGVDGLDGVRMAAAGAAVSLREGGRLVLEIDARRAGPSVDIVRSHGFSVVDVHDDLFGRPRYLTAS